VIKSGVTDVRKSVTEFQSNLEGLSNLYDGMKQDIAKIVFNHKSLTQSQRY